VSSTLRAAFAATVVAMGVVAVASASAETCRSDRTGPPPAELLVNTARAMRTLTGINARRGARLAVVVAVVMAGLGACPGVASAAPLPGRWEGDGPAESKVAFVVARVLGRLAVVDSVSWCRTVTDNIAGADRLRLQVDDSDIPGPGPPSTFYRLPRAIRSDGGFPGKRPFYPPWLGIKRRRGVRGLAGQAGTPDGNRGQREHRVRPSSRPVHHVDAPVQQDGFYVFCGPLESKGTMTVTGGGRFVSVEGFFGGVSVRPPEPGQPPIVTPCRVFWDTSFIQTGPADAIAFAGNAPAALPGSATWRSAET
jgi:hypothetical protein